MTNQSKIILLIYKKNNLHFRYGVKPEWLLVHRVLNHKHLRDGRMMYLVKWRDLSYSASTWEHENAEYTDLKSFIDYYWV